MKPLLGCWVLLGSLVVCAGASVKVSEESIVVPTYAAGEPEPNPMFYFGRGSQGAQGRVYPYPLYDSLTHIKTNKSYRILRLENEYIRIGILPEIGGRLFEAVDKSNGYDFIYRQHVIKPALIGLIGAWISGGIEWNIPHHHRATTFLPVQYRVEENADGSKTIWVGELELRHRMRWAVGYTLRPGKSFLECKVRILNHTPVVNTMLCFANVAVHVNENYQVIYPPSTRFVTFHGKREFTTWPVATTRYAGEDFSQGVDVSWYSNHVGATSMFAWNYEDDFFAGYDHGREAGLMSVADHHIVPGKKFWTWGTGPRGRMWDKILTDTDGPYIELMVGGYSDNQPDYSWLQPGETKSFSMYWYPFRDIGGVKRANLEAAVNLEMASNGVAKVGFFATRPHRSARMLLKVGEQVLWEERRPLDPTKGHVKLVPVPEGVQLEDLRALMESDGKELIAYSPVLLDKESLPEPVKPPSPPKDVPTVEELALAGERIEQFHAPGQEPEPYWEEALRREPTNALVNTLVGVRKLKQARFEEAETHLRRAIERLAANYTTPQDGAPHYYLGLALRGQGKRAAAFDALYKATWSAAWRAPAYFELAEIACRQGDFPAALDFVDRSLYANALDTRAVDLKAAILRHLGRSKDALALLRLALRETDPLDVRGMAERWLAGDKKTEGELSTALRDYPATGLEVAAGFANAGLWRDGLSVLKQMVDGARDENRISPLVYYYLGDFAERLDDKRAAAEFRRRAAQLPPDYIFPFQWEAIPVLKRAIEVNPRDARAMYYLGNLLFDWQPEAAVTVWARSAELEPSFALVQRNLAAAYAHQKPTPDTAKAIQCLESAVNSPVKYALHFAELDELYAQTGVSPAKRLSVLEQNQQVVSKRDDALSREIGLKVFAGKYDEAIQLMTGRWFSVWEGGTLEVSDHWVNAHLLRAREKLAKGLTQEAMADLGAAKTLPDNLPSDSQQRGGRESELAYWTGMVQDKVGEAAKARECWQDAARAQMPAGRRRSEEGLSERQVQVYYQALAKSKLGQGAEAETALRGLVEQAQRSLDPEQSAKEGTALASNKRLALAHYIAGLGRLGLGEKEQASSEFELALKAAPDHLGAATELRRLR